MTFRSSRPMVTAATAAVVLTFLLTACGSSGVASTSASRPGAPSFATGSSAHTLEVGGVERSYIVYRPAALPASRPAPLVVMLHGGFGSAAQAERKYGWDSLADANHFLVVYPDGVDHAWNAGGGCCGKAASQGVDDVSFITSVVAAVASETAVDPKRIYATGMSNGALMDYRLACSTDRFAAIGPVSGTLQGSCPDPRPVSVIHIHGSADTHVPYAGGTGSGPGHVDGLAVPAVVQKWTQVDGCQPPSTHTSGAVSTQTARCPDGRNVELITVGGAGHQWPGSPSRPLVQKILHSDPPSNALNATSTIWAFFAAHPKRN